MSLPIASLEGLRQKVRDSIEVTNGKLKNLEKLDYNSLIKAFSEGRLEYAFRFALDIALGVQVGEKFDPQQIKLIRPTNLPVGEDEDPTKGNVALLRIQETANKILAIDGI